MRISRLAAVCTAAVLTIIGLTSCDDGDRDDVANITFTITENGELTAKTTSQVIDAPASKADVCGYGTIDLVIENHSGSQHKVVLHRVGETFAGLESPANANKTHKWATALPGGSYNVFLDEAPTDGSSTTAGLTQLSVTIKVTGTANPKCKQSGSDPISTRTASPSVSVS